MQSRKYVSLKEKIEIFKEFHKTGEKLTGSTIFKGYPIGAWAIQIRNMINRKNRGENSEINPTLKQLEELRDLGILDRQIDTTIDEKIDMFVKWIAKYPNAEVGQFISREVLREYSKDEEEYGKLIEEYEKMRRYYDYVRQRKSRKKLTKKQMMKGKEGNVRGIFGYPTQVENLAKTTGQSEKNIEYIIINYGTMDNFIKLYRRGELVGKSAILAHSMIRDVIDIDLNPESDKIDRLYRDIMMMSPQSHSLSLYSSDKLMKALQALQTREKYVIERNYGLLGDSPAYLATIAPEIELSPERARQLKAEALIKLQYLSALKNFSIGFPNTKMLSDDERKILENLEDELYASEFIFRNRSFATLQNNSRNERILKAFKLIKNIGEITEDRRKQKREEEEERGNIPEETTRCIEFAEAQTIPIEELGLSSRVYNALKRNKINTLADISKLTISKLMKINRFGNKSIMELSQKVRKYGITLKNDAEPKQTEFESTDQEENGDTESQKIPDEDAFIGDLISGARRREELKTKEEKAAELEKQYEEQVSESVHLLDDGTK